MEEARRISPLGFVLQRKYAMPMVLVLLVVVFAATSPRFLSMTNLLSVMNSAAIGGLIALGMTYVLILGGIDLSVGSIISLTTVVLGKFLVDYPVDAGLALLIALIVGCLIGFLNGALVVKARIPAIIVTLGTMMIVQSIASYITQGTTKSLSSFPSVVFLGQGYIGPVPFPILIFLVLTVVLHVVLRKTMFGTLVRAVGGNAEASRQMGLSVAKIQIAVYMLSGMMASIAGLIVAGRLSMASSQAGSGWELPAITIAVLGGTSLFGGQGTVAGTFAGALIISILFNGLVMLGVPYFYQLIATGCILIVAMAINESMRK